MFAVACGGGGTPTGPGPVTPDPGPVVTNAPPVIGAFTVQGTRANEPPNFADVSEDLPISVEVTDAESPVTDLKFNWSAAVGTFSGSGRSITWKAPAVASTPTTVTIDLEIVETYTSQGKTIENKVTGSTTVALHNSVKEVGDLATQFLLDFSNSSLDVGYVMRHFQAGCYGTAAETSDVTNNRSNFTIIQSNVGAAVTSVKFGGVCSFRAKPGDGCARVPVYWKSIAKRDLYDGFTGELGLRAGEQTEVSGVDQVAAMYYRDQHRWRLCDSQFDSNSTSLRAASIKGMVP